MRVRERYFVLLSVGRINERTNHAGKQTLCASKQTHAYANDANTHGNANSKKKIPLHPYIVVIPLVRKLICQ